MNIQNCNYRFRDIMILYLTVVLVLLVKSTLSQSLLEVVGATKYKNTINVQKGETLTLTCRSDLESLTLEYASVIYNDTKMINGFYMVSFTKIAVRDDDNQLVTCRATNATGESLKIEAKVRVQVDVKITLNGVKNLTEGDTANISCTVSGSLYEPSGVMMVCIASDCTRLTNQTINTVYDNASETFTTVFKAASFSVTRYLNEAHIICPVTLNGSLLIGGDNVSVFYGPYQEGVYFSGYPDWYEGYPGGLACYSAASNPAVTLTWYNGSTVFSPDTPVSVTKGNGRYETRQEWNFKFSRYFSGSNISCVATGHQNKTVIKTRQFGVIHFAPELVILGNSIIDEGDTLNLTCEVIAASPMTNASWGPIADGSDELVIANVQRNQDGNYYNCFAENSVRKSRKDVRLTVQYGPDISLSWIRSVNEGASLTIQPYIKGNPEPIKFSWKKEGSDAVVSTDKNLFLENATREQAGVYIFEATSVRQRENNASKEVTGNASIIVKVRYGLGESLGLSPNISVIEFNEGDPVPQITCLADCVPECTVEWNQYYRNTMRYRSINAVLDLGNASSALVGIYMCEAIYDGKNRIRRNVTFELRVKYKPKIESVAVNDFNINLYSEGTPITTTAKVRAYPAAKLTWGIKNDRFTNQFLPLDSRYSVNRSVECSYDCEVTEMLTLSSASCTDTGNKFSVYAKNEKGNSTVQSVLSSIQVGCSPRPVNSSLINQTYSTCEGEELNMTASFLSYPGPYIRWYLSTDTSGRPLYSTYERGFRRYSIIHHTNYHIPSVYWYMFRAWIVRADNGEGSVGRAYIEVIQHPNCSGDVHSTFSVPHTTTSVQSTTLSAGNMAPSQGSGQTGVIVGSVIGTLLLIAIIVGGAIVFIRHRKKQKGNIKLQQFDLGMSRKT